MNATEITQVLAKTDACKNSVKDVFGQKFTLEIHPSDTFLQIKCVICVSQELRELASNWDNLPKGVKESILLFARSATA